MRRRNCLEGGLAAVASLAWPSVRAQGAGRTTRVIVGFPPGGAIDVVARLVAEQLAPRLGTVVVENRTGAGGRLACEAVKAAEPDGATLLFAPAAILALYPHVHRALRFDPLADFVPLAGFAQYAFCLAAGPGSQAKTLAEFVAAAKARPGAVGYATPGLGTPQHFIGAGLGKQAGAELLHVPYKGGGEAMKDFLGGQVPAIVTVAQLMLPQHQAGKARILATTGAAREPALPDVPTFREAGFAELTLADWFVLLAPTRTPAATVAALQEATRATRDDTAFAAGLARLNYRAMPDAAATLPARLKAENQAWGKLVAAANFQATD